MAVKTEEELGLENLLKYVDYKSLAKNYIPSTFAIKFINFVKMVNGGEGEENTSPVFHFDILDNILKHSNNLFVAFRGSAKTSLMEYLFLYMATYGELENFGKVNVAMYVGDTMENGCKNLRNNMEFRYNNSDFLQQFLPNPIFTDSRMEFTNLEGHRLYLKMFGASTGVRGFKAYGQRPVLSVLDDLMSDESARSKTIVSSIEDIIYKAVRQALHPTKRKVIWIGTPFNKADPLYKAAGSPNWNTKVYPVAEKFPCEEVDFVGAWEDRFNFKAVQKEYDFLLGSNKTDAFNQELMLRILSDEDRLLRDEDLVWYNRTDLLSRLHQYHTYITTDFATSENESADFSVISVWALDHTGTFHWVDGMLEKQDMAKNVDRLFEFVKKYNPLSVGVEVSGQQKGFVDWLKRDMVTRKIYFTLANDKNSGEEGLRPLTSKLTRFNVALPIFKARQIAFPVELKDSRIMLEFVDELTSITLSGIKSLNDDCIDTVSMLPLLKYVNPSDPTKSVTKEDKPRSKSKYFQKEEPIEVDTNSYVV